MPIKAQCSCGAAFAAKDELAGKTVKCPKCKKPLKIGPAGGAPAKSAAQPKQAAAAKPIAKPVKVKPIADEKAPAVPITSAESTFDEIGLQAAAVGTRPCPGCTEPMPLEAVICVKCGYNARLGRRMETAKLGGGGGDGPEGHGAVATGLMERAAQVLAEDAAEDIKKTGEGLPWWVYLIGLAALVGFLGTMIYRGCVYEAEEQKKKEKGQGQIQREQEVYIVGVESPATLGRIRQFSREAIFYGPHLRITTISGETSHAVQESMCRADCPC